jgi:predicted GNAT family N-acyltransferase
MTVHPLDMNRQGSAISRRAKPSLDDLDPNRLGRRTVIFTPAGHVIDQLVQIGQKKLRGLASRDVVSKVASHNPHSLWALARRDAFSLDAPKPEGFIAFLMLRKEGLRQLAAGTLDRRNPDLSLLAPQGERPAGIYCWAVCAPPSLIGAVPAVREALSTPTYNGVSLYCWVSTPEGKRFVESLGFRPGAPLAGSFASQLHFYPRGEDRLSARPTYDSYRGTATPGKVSVTIARSFEDIAKIVSIRSAVYMAEQDCPFEEEFDGNDFSSTHLIGYIGDEPAGCLRIRYFSNFVKMERLAVRHEFRTSKLSFKIVRAAIDLCRRKGYRRVYGHVRKDLVRFWEVFGFRLIPDRPEFNFSGIAFLEMAGDLQPDHSAITFGTDPFVMIRPEGRWDEVGILERSASRGASSMPAERVS